MSVRSTSSGSNMLTAARLKAHAQSAGYGRGGPGSRRGSDMDDDDDGDDDDDYEDSYDRGSRAAEILAETGSISGHSGVQPTVQDLYEAATSDEVS